MIKVTVVLAILFIVIAQSAVFDSSKLFLQLEFGVSYVMDLFCCSAMTVAQRLDLAFRTLSGDVVGNQRELTLWD